MKIKKLLFTILATALCCVIFTSCVPAKFSPLKDDMPTFLQEKTKRELSRYILENYIAPMADSLPAGPTWSRENLTADDILSFCTVTGRFKGRENEDGSVTYEVGDDAFKEAAACYFDRDILPQSLSLSSRVYNSDKGSYSFTYIPSQSGDYVPPRPVMRDCVLSDDSLTAYCTVTTYEGKIEQLVVKFKVCEDRLLFASCERDYESFSPNELIKLIGFRLEMETLLRDYLAPILPLGWGKYDTDYAFTNGGSLAVLQRLDSYNKYNYQPDDDYLRSVEMCMRTAEKYFPIGRQLEKDYFEHMRGQLEQINGFYRDDLYEYYSDQAVKEHMNSIISRNNFCAIYTEITGIKVDRGKIKVKYKLGYTTGNYPDDGTLSVYYEFTLTVTVVDNHLLFEQSRYE